MGDGMWKFDRKRILILWIAILLAGCSGDELGDDDTGPADDDSSSDDDDTADDDTADDDTGDDDSSAGDAGVLAWVGGPSETWDVPRPHCVYRQVLGEEPEAVVCEDAMEYYRVLSFTAPPDLEQRAAIVTTELIVDSFHDTNPYPEFSDQYEFGVEEVWRIDLDGGDATLVTYHLAANYFCNPYHYVQEVDFLPDGRLVLDLAAFFVPPNDLLNREIVIVDGEGVKSDDVLPSMLDKVLQGVMADGSLLVEVESEEWINTAELWLVEPDSGEYEVLVPADGQTFGHISISPDGQSVLYSRPESQGPSYRRVAVATAEGSSRLAEEDADTVEPLGWMPDGRVLLERDAALLTWDGTDGGAAEPLVEAPAGDWHPWKVATADEFVAVNEWNDTSGRVRLVSDDGDSIPCESVERVDAVGFVVGGDTARVVYSDAEANRVYTCTQDGVAEDPLEPFGMRGLPLGYEPPLTYY